MQGNVSIKGMRKKWRAGGREGRCRDNTHDTHTHTKFFNLCTNPYLPPEGETMRHINTTNNMLMTYANYSDSSCN